jgi:hypothetical protein
MTVLFKYLESFPSGFNFVQTTNNVCDLHQHLQILKKTQELFTVAESGYAIKKVAEHEAQ